MKRIGTALFGAVLLVALVGGSLAARSGDPPRTGVPGVGAQATESPAASASPSGLARASPGASAREVRVERGLVTHIVDGDTIDVVGVGRIRVIGIDTPERGACGYDSATLAMAALVANREVVLTSGARSDADRYDRLLRYVDVNGVDAGLQLIEDGWAIARYDSRDGYGAHPRELQYVRADAATGDLGCYEEDE